MAYYNNACSYEQFCAETGYDGPADEEAYDNWTNWAEGRQGVNAANAELDV